MGNVPSPGCGSFEVVRDNTVAAQSQQQQPQSGSSGQRAATAAAQPSRWGRGWEGDWIGTLDCGKGDVRLRLLLSRHRDPALGVRGEILSIGGKKPSGVPYFSMNGEADGGRMRLRWDKWAAKPLSDRPMKFDGEYAASDDALALKPLDSTCRPFTMSRVRLDDLSAAAPAGTAASRGGANNKPGQSGTSFPTFMTQLGEKGKNVQRLVGSTLQLHLQ